MTERMKERAEPCLISTLVLKKDEIKLFYKKSVEEVGD